MASEFLRSHGIDIDAEMARIQKYGQSAPGEAQDTLGPATREVIQNVSLPGTEPDTRWDVTINNGHVFDISPHTSANSPSSSGTRSTQGHSALLAPSLCHPHIHLDKAFLLPHPKYSHLQISSGTFAEAMELTGTAKAQFEHSDLLERGQRVIDESIAAGVTHMRAFVEVDSVAKMKCLDAGIELKRRAKGKVDVQICAFAQLPLFTMSQGDENGDEIRRLMTEAAQREDVAAVGSTPYVEDLRSRMEDNVNWMIDLSIAHDKYLDFHLDYNLDPDTPPLIWHVVSALQSREWKSKVTKDKTIVLGHCTRLCLFTADELFQLATTIHDSKLPISFVGLPTSDLYMMRPPSSDTGAPHGRTLDTPALIADHGLNGCIGINNIGNAFTPQGSCDPLSLASAGVGIYQRGGDGDAEMLYECVSTRARQAIGVDLDVDGQNGGLEIKVGQKADLLLFGREGVEWRTRRTVKEAIYLYDAGKGRKAWCSGQHTYS